jgi:hypothetical protein
MHFQCTVGRWMGQIRNRLATYPIFGPVKAGRIWQLSSIFTHVVSLAAITRAPSW